MAKVTVNQIERQFVHLSSTEQLALLQRLVQQSRVSGADPGGFRDHHLGAPIVFADPQHESDRNEGFRAAGADRLSEVE
jgi:hypothetical protein